MNTQLIHSCYNVHGGFNRVFGDGTMLLSLDKSAINIKKVEFYLRPSDILIDQVVGTWYNISQINVNETEKSLIMFDGNKTWEFDVQREFFQLSNTYIHHAKITSINGPLMDTEAIYTAPKCSSALAIALVVITTLASCAVVIIAFICLIKSLRY